MQSSVRSILVAIGSLVISATALADASKFNGRYVKGNGSYNVYGKNGNGHSIELFGNGKGKYCLNGTKNCGELYDIVINGGEADIVGKYNFNGSRGTFQWDFNDSDFSGGFRFNQNMQPSAETGSIYTPYNGEWTGHLN